MSDDGFSDSEASGSMYSTDSNAEEQEEEEDAFIDDYDFDEADAPVERAKEPYVACTAAQLEEKRSKCVTAVTSVLGIALEDAQRCLRVYKWNPARVNEEWFSEPELRSNLGILAEEDAVPSTSTPTQCKICFDICEPAVLRHCRCGHHYCSECWRGYLTTSVASGPGVLSLRCPDPDCSVAVPDALFEELLGPADAEKWRRYAANSFVDDNPLLSWCTAPGCAVVTESSEEPGGRPMDISCPCGQHFCFSCKEEAHRPVDCETVKRWHVKNSNESENMNWILANTKPCPRCKRPIEKNQGCMHMTCSQCRYEFCWLCSGAWKDHGERTGGYYACNKYTSAKKAGELDEEERRRENAKNSLERYMHYFERFNCHDKARLLALGDMERHLSEESERLSERVQTPTSQLKFITDAWMQVIDCRRILKWSYAYGYYGMDDESEDGEHTKDFFEFLQGDAEGCLEKLHEILEKQLHAFLAQEPCVKPGTPGAAQQQSSGSPVPSAGDRPASTRSPSGTPALAGGGTPPPAPPCPLAEFAIFRQTLTGMTDVTRSYFTKLVDQMEKGFGQLEEDFATVARAQNSFDELMDEAALLAPSSSAAPSTSSGVAQMAVDAPEPAAKLTGGGAEAAEQPLRRSGRLRMAKKTRGQGT